MPGGGCRHELTAVVIYPNTRDVAFASLGYLKVHELLKQRLRLADFSYLPVRGDPVVSPRKALLLGETSGNEVSRFDIIAFSVSYENDYVNIPELLLQAGLPPLAADRADTFPVVICGGFTMSLNPLPVADLADVVVVGEFEAVADSLVESMEEARLGRVSKQEMLNRIGTIRGVYVPSRGERTVERVWCDADSIATVPERHTASHFGDMFLVEVGRGCSRGCLFCAAGNLYRPVRMRDAGSILESAGSSGRVGLVGTAVGDHPDLTGIMDSLLAEGRTAGISSLRADQITAEVADRLAMCGIKTIAVAPETGTDELRGRIGKGITREQIFEAVRLLSAAGIATVKLYFMIGLPGESDEDVEAIVSLVTELAGIRGKSRLSVAAGPFVPKPHTAFQWAGFASRKTLRHRIRILRGISRLKGCTLKVGSIDEAWSEAVLARGDRSLSSALIDAAVSKRSLRAALKKAKAPDPCRELDTTEPLPWNFLDCGVSRERLLKQYLESRRV